MRQLMTQRFAYCLVVSVPIICICPESQLDDFAFITVEPQRAGFVGRVLRWVHFGEEWDAEFVRAHSGFYAGIITQTLKE